MNPEVAEYFIRNKSVFRPIFQSATEMQQFMNEYAKTQIVLEDLAKAGLRPDKQLVIKAREARNKQHKMLQDLETAMSQESMKKLFPNVPFKNRMEWGSALVKRDLAKAAKENNSEIKIINVNGVGDSFAIKITPEMLLPHKTHRKDGGMVYTPEIIDIFEAA